MPFSTLGFIWNMHVYALVCSGVMMSMATHHNGIPQTVIRIIEVCNDVEVLVVLPLLLCSSSKNLKLLTITTTTTTAAAHTLPPPQIQGVEGCRGYTIVMRWDDGVI